MPGRRTPRPLLLLALSLLPGALPVTPAAGAGVPRLQATPPDALTISVELAGSGAVELQTRAPGEAGWTSQGARPLSPSPQILQWQLPQYRVPDSQDAFAYRFVARQEGKPYLLFPGREFRGPMFAAPPPEFSPAVQGFTLTYFLLDPRPLQVTLQVWDPVVGANLFGGGRWVTVYSRKHRAGQAGRVTEPLPSPFDAFDVGRPSSYRLLVSYGGEPIKWRESALFAVSGTSWLTYAAVLALLLVAGAASAALWPLIRSRARLQEELLLAEVRSRARQRGMTLLANKIGHEAEAWMASIRWLSALLRREVGAACRAFEYVEELERATDQLGAYLLRLKEYGRPPSPMRAPVRIGEALRTARLRAEHSLQAAGVEVRERLSADGWVMGDESEIAAALGNLIQNAAEAMARTERRTLMLTTRQIESGRITIEISDTGHGIPEEVAESLFDPFRSTRGEGRGLGLAIARKNVEAHSGAITCRPGPDGGTTFLVTFPCEPASVVETHIAATPQTPAYETAEERR